MATEMPDKADNSAVMTKLYHNNLYLFVPKNINITEIRYDMFKL